MANPEKTTTGIESLGKELADFETRRREVTCRLEALLERVRGIGETEINNKAYFISEMEKKDVPLSDGDKKWIDSERKIIGRMSAVCDDIRSALSKVEISSMHLEDLSKNQKDDYKPLSEREIQRLWKKLDVEFDVAKDSENQMEGLFRPFLDIGRTTAKNKPLANLETLDWKLEILVSILDIKLKTLCPDASARCDQLTPQLAFVQNCRNIASRFTCAINSAKWNITMLEMIPPLYEEPLRLMKGVEEEFANAIKSQQQEYDAVVQKESQELTLDDHISRMRELRRIVEESMKKMHGKGAFEQMEKIATSVLEEYEADAHINEILKCLGKADMQGDEAEEIKRLGELYERLDKASMQGDEAGEKVIRNEIKRYLEGTSASADKEQKASSDSPD